MIIVKGQASEFIKEFNPVVGTAISKTQEGMMNMQDETGLFNDTSFGDFIDQIKSSKRQPIAVLAALNDFSHLVENGPRPETIISEGDYYAGELPRSGGNRTEYLGTALFNGGKMIGELNGDETRSLLMATGKFEKGSFAIPDRLDPKLINTIFIVEKKCRI